MKNIVTNIVAWYQNISEMLQVSYIIIVFVTIIISVIVVTVTIFDRYVKIDVEALCQNKY